MVSRRTYFTITIMMLVILFMFQFTGVIKETQTDYETNQFASSAETGLTSEDTAMAPPDSSILLKKAYPEGEDGYILFIGDSSESLFGATVAQWGVYTKREILALPSLEQYLTWKSNPPEVILLDSAYLNYDTDIPILRTLAKQGINLIFCNLPDYSDISQNKDLQELLGIQETVSNQVQLAGIQLFQGFLFGGEVIYENDSIDPTEPLASLDKEEMEIEQDLDFEIPWYLTKSGTKTYMMGQMEDETIENGDLPPIIWRNGFGSSFVFAVNGDYLRDSTGIGILTAMMAEMHTYEIYPVVNAQNLVIANYPGLASENEEVMEQLYFRTQKAVFRDVIWPQIAIVAERSGAKLSCMAAPQLDYTNGIVPDGSSLVYYLKLLHEENAEVGFSASRISDTTLEAKLEQDYTLWKNYMPSYNLLSLYVDNKEDYRKDNNENHSSPDFLLNQPLLENIRTLFTNYDETLPVFSYAGDKITLQSAVMDGYRYTYSGDLRLRSLQTALGYSSILLDMKRVSYPETRDDAWEKVSEHFAITMDTCLENFQVFEKTTLTESDKRIREFLTLDYTHKRNGYEIIMDITDFHEEAWFILRTHGEQIDSIWGGSFEKIESNAYLIRADKREVVITVKQDPEPYFYD